MIKNQRHLDLGCGEKPYNPFESQELHGIDIREISEVQNNFKFTYTQANLITNPIPYPDNHFDSVSAIDFLEHIPRQILLPNGNLKNSFVDLMSEIYRVLKPNGLLVAFTPAFPHYMAFTDPTHVNFITYKTHTYFIGESPLAKMYGFQGHFNVQKVMWENSANFKDKTSSELKKMIKRFHRRFFHRGLSHLIWELRAEK